MAHEAWSEPERDTTAERVSGRVDRLVRLQWDEYQPRWWIVSRDGNAVAAFRFETPDVNSRRDTHEKARHPIGVWGAWLKTEAGTEHLMWPEKTPVAVMQLDVEAIDIRLR